MSQPEEQPPVVLVAEDDEDIRGLVVYRLERSGYGVVVAADGEEAERLAVEHRPALCIFDVMMPKVDGYELTRRLRGRDETKRSSRSSSSPSSSRSCSRWRRSRSSNSASGGIPGRARWRG